MSVQYIISGDGNINVFVNGCIFTINRNTISYKAIYDALKDRDTTEDTINKLLNPTDGVKYITNGRVEVDLTTNQVKYDGVVFPDKSLCERILRLCASGYSCEYMLNFLNRLCANPNFRSVMELFGFIQRKGFPITESGHILAYKGITSDYKDCYTRRFDNSVGTVNKMNRKDGDDNHRLACSNGFHIGTFEYARGFGHRVVLVEVDPANVISVPSYETDKMRCCEYRVVADYDNQSYLEGEVYNSDGKRITVKEYAQFDNDCGQHWDEHCYGLGDDYDDDYDDDDDYESDDDDDDYEARYFADSACCHDEEDDYDYFVG